MKKIVLVLVALAALALQAPAWATTYTYSSPGCSLASYQPFTVPCAAGLCR